MRHLPSFSQDHDHSRSSLSPFLSVQTVSRMLQILPEGSAPKVSHLALLQRFIIPPKLLWMILTEFLVQDNNLLLCDPSQKYTQTAQKACPPFSPPLTIFKISIMRLFIYLISAENNKDFMIFLQGEFLEFLIIAKLLRSLEDWMITLFFL